ncbi:dihydropteroate synthase [Burkholderia multivorans]|uniref:dihydropteroate synthase n=1 Tax=Burkholderia multivorans TaxID=87883 RepID=UPI00209E8655|nr:dihydropteroate synthase [Burkholderia multivorans]MCO8613535.1 dihydropteroate synthase [Burkholderia multivorans]MCO8632833.1 dihydropteroate synthase [Burkholderia multivorans]MCO8640483.1 dihydropteroate synthase [Burkholderia multivorans]
MWFHTGPFCILPLSRSVSDSTASPSIPAPLRCGRFTLTFERPLVMGILNATPDSFSDGGRFLAYDDAVRQAERMIADGADILDIGGESTRPGAPPVPLDEELARVIPLVEALRPLNVPLSIDTYKPAVMRAALAAGADLINDIWGFRQPGAIDAVRDGDSGLCAMHMLGEPQTMQVGEPDYGDVVADVRDFLAARAQALRDAGVAPERICVDPGFGFGKAVVDDNYALLAALPDTAPLRPDGRAYPLLAGMSRKSMLGAVIGGKPPMERIAASVAAALCAVERGAAIVRVHDVAATVDALKVWCAVREAARQR